MKRKYAFLFLAICLVFNGCASVSYHMDTSSFVEISPGIYPGFRADINAIKHALKGEVGASRSWLDPVVFAGFLVDLPLTLFIDTALLPYGIVQYIWRAEDEEIEASVEEEAEE